MCLERLLCTDDQSGSARQDLDEASEIDRETYLAVMHMMGYTSVPPEEEAKLGEGEAFLTNKMWNVLT